MKFLVTLIALITISTPCFASMVGTETNLDSNITTQKVLVQQPIGNEGLGGFAFSCQNKYWGQSYAGLTYCPKPYRVEVALGYGVEQAPKSDRLGGWIWAGKDRLSAIFLFENGGSGSWTKLEIKYQLSNKLSVGYANQEFAGKGPLAEYRFGQGTSVKLHVTKTSNFFHLTQNF